MGADRTDGRGAAWEATGECTESGRERGTRVVELVKRKSLGLGKNVNGGNVAKGDVLL